MTELPELEDVFRLHAGLIARSGGSTGLRDRSTVESALAQPDMAFGGRELYPSLAEKASALCFSLVRNHPFVDGNKRIGHAAMILLLKLNGHNLSATADEGEAKMLALASGSLTRDELTAWVRARLVPAGAA